MEEPKTIIDAIKEFKKIKTEYSQFIANHLDITRMLDDGMEPNLKHPEVITYFKTVNLLKSKLEDCVKKIYKLSLTENYYFFDCPYKVYNNTLTKRGKQFIKRFDEASIINFYNNELPNLKLPGQFRFFLDDKGEKWDYARFIGSNAINFKFSLEKKIQLLHSLISDPSIEINASDNNIPKNTELDPIFLDQNGQKLFDRLIENFSISRNTITKRGTQAKLHAIWEVKACKENIFREYVQLDEYIKYLNKRFGTIYNSRSLSDGSSHHDNVKKWIKSIQ